MDVGGLVCPRMGHDMDINHKNVLRVVRAIGITLKIGSQVIGANIQPGTHLVFNIELECHAIRKAIGGILNALRRILVIHFLISSAQYCGNTVRPGMVPVCSVNF